MNTSLSFENIREMFDRIFKANAVRREILNLPDAERENLFRELGISEPELNQLISGHSGPEIQLPKRLHTAGLDPDAVSLKYGAVMRDMERVCSLCSKQKCCARDLNSNEDHRVSSYCPNTLTVDALVADH